MYNVHTCTCTYIHIYIHTYIHTYILVCTMVGGQIKGTGHTATAHVPNTPRVHVYGNPFIVNVILSQHNLELEVEPWYKTSVAWLCWVYCLSTL